MNADVIFHTRTHLGAVLKAGDTVLGYMLGNSNFNNDHWDLMDQTRTPEVMLVRKTYPNRRKKSKARGWRLKSIVSCSFFFAWAPCTNVCVLYYRSRTLEVFLSEIRRLSVWDESVKPVPSNIEELERKFIFLST